MTDRLHQSAIDNEGYSALIPLRGGSKSIPQKNIRSLCNKPLCAWVLEAALNCSLISEVAVSTDCPIITSVVKSISPEIIIIPRPDAISGDTSPTEETMLHALGYLSGKKLVTIQATSPLLSAEDLFEAIHQFEDTGAESMLSAVRTKRFFWNDDGTAINYDPTNRPMRQAFNGTLTENGAFYITDRDLLLSSRCRLGGKISIYEMPSETFIEIDEPEDWDAVEALLRMRTL